MIIVSKGKSSHLMKASANRRKSRAQIEQEKLQAQQREADIALKMQQFAQLQNDLNNMVETKQHVEALFQNGFLFRDADGSVAMPANEEMRQQIAESARKPAPGSKQHQAFIFESPVLGGPEPEEAKRNLDRGFQDAEGSNLDEQQ